MRVRFFQYDIKDYEREKECKLHTYEESEIGELTKALKVNPWIMCPDGFVRKINEILFNMPENDSYVPSIDVHCYME